MPKPSYTGKTRKDGSVSHCDPIAEEVLTNACVNWNDWDYYLENLSFLYSRGWWKLGGRLMNLLRKPWSLTWWSGLCLRKLVGKSKATKGSNSKKMPCSKRETRCFSLLPPFPCEAKQVTTLLEQWIKEIFLLNTLLEVEFFPWVGDLKDWSTVHITWRKNTHCSSVSPLEGFFMGNIKHEKFFCKKKQSTSKPSISKA